MDKLESHTSKEAAWRSRLLRHAQSGKTIAAFCRDESVSTASFHIWRAKLAGWDSKLRRTLKYRANDVDGREPISSRYRLNQHQAPHCFLHGSTS